MAECKVKENQKKCTCSSTTCQRHGVCCECVAYHRENGDLPGCLRENRQ